VFLLEQATLDYWIGQRDSTLESFSWSTKRPQAETAVSNAKHIRTRI
jgi:hypothetical protein